MDQKKTGSLLRKLRKEKGYTQEELAEIMGVSNRTVSRWETGSNMPDISILVELADYYGVDIRELIDGERKSEKMDKDVKETALKVADYNKEERRRLMERLHIFSWLGVASFTVFIVLEILGLAESGVTESIASVCAGFAYGILATAVLYTSRHMRAIFDWKRKVFRRGRTMR